MTPTLAALRRAVAVAVVVAAVLGAGCTPATDPRPVTRLAAAPTSATSEAVALPDRAMPAGPPLRLLRQRASATTDRAGAGRYAYVHLRLWAADAAPHPGRRAAVSMVEFDEHRWRGPDGTARIITTRVTPPAGTQTTDHGPNTEPGALVMGPDPLPTDPATLKAELHRLHPPLLGPAGILRAVGDLAGWHLVTREQRITMLAVLADTARLTWLGHTTDRAGRPGVAVCFDDLADMARDLLILDTDTGDVLAYQYTAVLRPGAAAVVLPAEQYAPYLVRGGVAVLGAVPAPPGPEPR